MFNVFILALEYLISSIAILLALRFLKKEGAYAVISTLIIASNLGVAKLFNLFGLEVTAANMSMGMAFVIYSILTEVYGQNEGRKAVWTGFFAQFIFIMLGLVYTSYLPSESDFAQSYLSQVFAVTPRIAIASWTAFILSGYIAVWLHETLKKRKTKLWFRNNVATKIGQIADNLIFVTIAFLGIVDFKTYLQIFVTTTAVEFFLDYIDTWIVYFGVKLLKDEISSNDSQTVVSNVVN